MQVNFCLYINLCEVIGMPTEYRIYYEDESELYVNKTKEEKEKLRQSDTNQNGSFLNDSSLTNNSGQGYSNEGVTGATNTLTDSQEMKAKRSEVARKVLPLASNQMLRELLQDLCENADEQTLNIIMKHV